MGWYECPCLAVHVLAVVTKIFLVYTSEVKTFWLSDVTRGTFMFKLNTRAGLSYAS